MRKMMTAFGYNNKYITKDTKPWFPVMGEIHYSRYPKKYWKESLYKMKAGGVEVVSAYTIWIHHEEIEGEYDFTDNKDLRSFATEIKKCGLYMLLRIGPWVHAEARNGGFPDWMLQKGYELRSNDPGYLEEVRKFYTKLYAQVKGLLHKDGGPIIGIQIENELGHCGGAYGEAGEEHMKSLHKLALEIGFDVPFYTATGWGGAVTGGLLPVMGGYCEAPWDQRLTEIEPSGNYVFTYERNDHNIGSDHGLGVGVTFDFEDFPYLTAELGGGMQVTHHRRPVAEAEDIGAMSLAKLGSGCNLLGYYMYHGGTNPKGKLSTLQESRATGYLNDYTELNYDFRAPIREFGQVSDTLKEIKLYAMFAKDFGSDLCRMPAYIPEDNPISPDNLDDLRYSIRHDGYSGYLFVNNYQRRYEMKEHKEVVLSAKLPQETITYSAMTIKDRDYFFLPFHMKIGNALLKKAMVTPLCILDNDDKAYVFYGDRAPEYDLQGDLENNVLITISRKDARNAWKVRRTKEHLIISEAAVLSTDQGLEFIGRDKLSFKVYPDLETAPEGWVNAGTDGEFTIYEKVMQDSVKEKHLHKANETSLGAMSCIDDAAWKYCVSLETKLVQETPECKTYELHLEFSEETPEDLFVRLMYQGDRARLYSNKELITDHFYTGRVWEIGLKRFDFPKQLLLEVYPLKEDAQIYLEQWPVMKNGVACELSSAAIEVEYKAIMK